MGATPKPRKGPFEPCSGHTRRRDPAAPLTCSAMIPKSPKQACCTKFRLSTRTQPAGRESGEAQGRCPRRGDATHRASSPGALEQQRPTTYPRKSRLVGERPTGTGPHARPPHCKADPWPQRTRPVPSRLLPEALLWRQDQRESASPLPPHARGRKAAARGVRPALPATHLPSDRWLPARPRHPHLPAPGLALPWTGGA